MRPNSLLLAALLLTTTSAFLYTNDARAWPKPRGGTFVFDNEIPVQGATIGPEGGTIQFDNAASPLHGVKIRFLPQTTDKPAEFLVTLLTGQNQFAEATPSQIAFRLRCQANCPDRLNRPILFGVPYPEGRRRSVITAYLLEDPSGQCQGGPCTYRRLTVLYPVDDDPARRTIYFSSAQMPAALTWSYLR